MSPPLFGFADLHAHPMAHLGFGRAVVSGDARGKVEEALVRCDRATATARHPGFGAPGWLNLVRFGAESRHGCCGFPSFAHWPRFDTVLHQQMFVGWVHRAWQGGLRLMCALAVNNELLARELGASVADDRTALLEQVAGMRALAEENAAWMGVAGSPAEARALVAEGKLAVVLGVEVDSLDRLLLAPGEPLTEAGMDALVRFLVDEAGVRVVTPVHLADNAFGGAAVYSDKFNLLNHHLRGDFYRVEAAEHLGFRLSAKEGPDRVAIEYYRLRHGGRYPDRLYDGTGSAQGGHRNARGLTPLGEGFLRRLMRGGLLVDVDHMSERMTDAVLALAEAADYPVLSTHTTFRALAFDAGQTSRIEKRAHEGMKSTAHAQRILQGGGVLAPMTNQYDVRQAPGSPVANDCARSSRTFAQAYHFATTLQRTVGGRGGVALGTDFNGLAQQPGPRFGPHAASGVEGDRMRSFLRRLQRLAQAGSRLEYGGVMHRTDVPFTRHTEGERTFDLNEDGLAHYGLLPDFLKDLLRVGLSEKDLDPLFSSAEAFVATWEKCERRAAVLDAVA
jgi:microsomal dipeptidase-like Zn-dependent dipeptidase